MGKLQGAIRGAIGLCALAAALHVAAAPTYRLTDLGTLGGPNSAAWDINDKGQVAGTSDVLGGATRAFLWNGSTMIDLGTVGGRTHSSGGHLNAASHVIGNAANGFDDPSGFVYQGAAPMSLSPLPGHDYNYAFDINDYGVVTGMSRSADWSSVTAYVHDGAFMTALPTLGGSYAEGNGINNHGHVTGQSSLANGEHHAFFWDGTDIHDLGTLGGASAAGASINASDVIAGFSQVAPVDPLDPWSAHFHAFMHDGAGMHDLGTLGGAHSFAYGINDANWVVGASMHAASAGDRADTHGFLYDGSLHDLNHLLDASGAGWVVSAAGGINASGQIAATAWINGMQHAVLLSPTVVAVPEPQTYALMLAGLLAVATVARRR